MESLDQITRALGTPRALWRLQLGSKTVAAVARWQHSGAVIDLSRADAYQVILNLSGGQIVDLPELTGPRLNIRAGSVGVNSPEGAGLITVNGQADTLQILVSRDLIRSTPEGSTAASPARSTIKPELQAAAVQALVALENGTAVDRSQLERIVLETSKHLSPLPPVPARMSKGGLSPAARRRVCAVYEDWFADPAKPSPCVKDLANAAGLSLFYFTRSFHKTEGETPHARLLAVRVKRALELLLQTEAPINWISDVTCFSSPSHFVSTFRSHMGVTPGAFRHAAHSRQ